MPQRTYSNLSEREDLSFLDYLELQRVVCPDFSAQFCEDVAKCLTTTGSLSNTLGFQPFLSMFQLLFYYSEFMMHAGEVYRKCMTSAAGPGGGKHGVVRSIAFLEAVRAYMYVPAAPGTGAAAGGNSGGGSPAAASNYPKPTFEVVEAVLQQLTDAAQEAAVTEAADIGEDSAAAGGAGDGLGAEAAAAAAAAGEAFHRIPVVGGVPITFNDVCAALARRKEVAAMFADDWRATVGGGPRHMGAQSSSADGSGSSGRHRRSMGGSSGGWMVREHGGAGGHGQRQGVDCRYLEGEDDDGGNGAGFGGFGRGGALPEGFGRPSVAGSPGAGVAGALPQAQARPYAGDLGGQGRRDDYGAGGDVSVSTATRGPATKKKTTGKKKKKLRAKKATPTN